MVECELPVRLDADEIADLATWMPIPSTLLRELAARVPFTGSDPRWNRAHQPLRRRPTERGVTRIGSQVTNPRDDRPEIGIEVDRDFLALDGRYGGSTGQASETALFVGDGAIATFVRCDLTVGRGSSIAKRDATIVLVDCILPELEWDLGINCHLVILGGQLQGQLRIHTAPTATVTVEGLIERRVSSVSLISNAPRGIPIVVDGETYGWEKDDSTGSSYYTGRDRSVHYEHLTHASRPTISFEVPDRRSTVSGWWRESLVTERIAARAVQIAVRRGATLLTPNEVEEAFEGHGLSLQDELVAARAALDGLTRPEPDNTCQVFVRCMLAIGCTERTPEAQLAIDDWVASYADDLRAARDDLQRLCDEHVWNILQTRSAIEFLREICARMNVELDLDLERLDRGVARYRNNGRRPVGIPPSHDWFGMRETPTDDDDDDDVPGPYR